MHRLGRHGTGVTADLASFSDVEIAALCDVDVGYAEPVLRQFAGRPAFRDDRELLETVSDLHAVMIATPGSSAPKACCWHPAGPARLGSCPNRG